MSPRLEREAAQDDVSDYAQRFAPIPPSTPDPRPPVTMIPAHLANCIVPRRNVIAEYCALPVERLVDEANELTARLLSSHSNPRDYAIVVALIRRVRRESPSLDGSLWLDMPAVV